MKIEAKNGSSEKIEIRSGNEIMKKNKKNMADPENKERIGCK